VSLLTVQEWAKKHDVKKERVNHGHLAAQVSPVEDTEKEELNW
jgi:hypothetical protein